MRPIIYVVNYTELGLTYHKQLTKKVSILVLYLAEWFSNTFSLISIQSFLNNITFRQLEVISKLKSHHRRHHSFIFFTTQ